jgi:hypothetical protein
MHLLKHEVPTMNSTAERPVGQHCAPPDTGTMETRPELFLGEMDTSVTIADGLRCVPVQVWQSTHAQSCNQILRRSNT